MPHTLSTPPRPARTPLNTMARTMFPVTLIPPYSAAVGLKPTARISYPAEVFQKKIDRRYGQNHQGKEYHPRQIGQFHTGDGCSNAACQQLALHSDVEQAAAECQCHGQPGIRLFYMLKYFLCIKIKSHGGAQPLTF